MSKGIKHPACCEVPEGTYERPCKICDRPSDGRLTPDAYVHIRAHLVVDGLVRDSGLRRLGSDGRLHVVWEAVEERHDA